MEKSGLGLPGLSASLKNVIPLFVNVLLEIIDDLPAYVALQ